VRQAVGILRHVTTCHHHRDRDRGPRAAGLGRS
jgi:hypothetical protein